MLRDSGDQLFVCGVCSTIQWQDHVCVVLHIPWDYALAAAVGLVAGGASNGVYDWPTISNIINKFYEWFHPTKTVK